LGYKYKNFVLETIFNKGFLIISKDDESNLFKPINSIEFSLGYMIKVFDKRKKRKGQNCPEF
jgi:energy-converting hydrogenase Eha subunit C